MAAAEHEAEFVTDSDPAMASRPLPDPICSNYEFRRRMGRGHHAFPENPYPFPADEVETSRLDALQDMHKILFGKNVFAPIEDLPGTEIVDLGTGSGKWAIEVAEEFPNANVRGLDLSPIQPTDLPSNCSFYVADITVGLDEQRFPTGSIDLVHMRAVHAGIKHHQWDGILRNIYRMLKPGNGWAELGEADQLLIDPSFQPPSQSAVWQWSTYLRQYHRTKDTLVRYAQDQKRLMEEIGFEDIQFMEKILDLGCYTEDPISRQAGLLAQNSLGSLWPTIGPSIVPIDDHAEKSAFIEKAVNELRSGLAPVGLRHYRLIGRKPAAGAEA